MQKKRILWVSPIQITVIVAIISFVLSFLIVGIMWLFNQFATTKGGVNNWAPLVVLPLLISFCASVFAALGALSYNLIAKLGLCITVRAEPNPPVIPEAPRGGGTPVS